MALTKTPIELSSTPGIVDNSNATAITIDSSENVMVNRTSVFTTAKMEIQSDASDASTLALNSIDTDGSMLEFYKAGSTVGSIGSNTGDKMYIGTGASGVGFSTLGLLPFNTTTNAFANNTLDLGAYGLTWKNGYFSGDVNATNFTGVGDGDTFIGMSGSNIMRFSTGNVERMRIDSSGNLLVGKTTTGDYVTGIEMQPAGAILSYRTSGVASIFGRTDTGEITRFTRGGVIVGSISTNSNSLPSDRNFKQNIQDLSLGLNFISSLEPVTYNYKIDEDGAPVMAGLIAQDVEIALTAAGVEANSMTLLQHNPTEDEKESDYQMDYLKLVPVLINAVKELTERLEQLENT